MATRRARRKPPTRRYELELNGDLKGFHVTMGSMSSRELIRLRSGEVNEAEAIELTASKVVEHDFDIDDIRDLDWWILLEISSAWSRAMTEVAVPPPTGDS